VVSICGIVTYWARESILTMEEYDILLEGASKRGNDGVGVTIWNSYDSPLTKKWVGPYEENKYEILAFICKNVQLHSVLFAICRATPETEKATTVDMLQPIVDEDEGLMLIHNGGVTDSMRDEVQYNFKTEIDSEMILAFYMRTGRNMQLCMEEISGSFAFVLLDAAKRKLYAVTSFNPLAHMYIRGYGYFLHSDSECLAVVLKELTGQTQDGVNVWESWYRHYISNFTILETDLESGFQFKQSYNPRFLHPIWDSLEEKGGIKTLVIASGGIDSGLTAHVLKSVGHDIEIVHFLYGQKAQDCEEWAVKKLGEYLSVPVRIIDLRFLYKEEKSMLISNDIEITTGGEKLKSSGSWVAGRNAVFAAVTMTISEQMIISGQCARINISAGWSQLSEECGGFVDNSFMFNECLEQLRMVGYITGSRMQFLPVMQRLTKTEEWVLGNYLKFPFQYTVSCDAAKMVGDHPELCIECGSTKLSILASDRAGVADPRKFLTPRFRLSEVMRTPRINEIIERLILTREEKIVLLEQVGE